VSNLLRSLVAAAALVPAVALADTAPAAPAAPPAPPPAKVTIGGLVDSYASVNLDHGNVVADPLRACDSIAQIALACGFTDFGHFSRRYKEAFGASPRDDRAAKHVTG